MNKVVLSGRLTRDPETRHSGGDNPVISSRYTLAVDRMKKDENGNSAADFISCVAFGKAGEFSEKYLRKGTKIIIGGRIQTGSYTNNEGRTIYTTDVIVESQEFCEKKLAETNSAAEPTTTSNLSTADVWTPVDMAFDEELPFA